MNLRELLESRKPLEREGALSSGSTLLNLACTDSPTHAFLPGSYYHWVGDSASGKTFTALTCFAEAANNKAFDKYALIHDDVEGGALMDIEYFFGKKVARRLEPPARTKRGEAIYSSTVESFYYNISDRIKAGKPFIYVLDSENGLTSESSDKKFQARKKASEKDEEAAGSYGDGKAKFHSENLRRVVGDLKDSGSILLIISQTRDNMGMGFDPKTYPGGKALKFYAHLQVWFAVGEKIKKTIREKERTIGMHCVAEVRKNRFTGKTGKDRQVKIPIYYDLGMDDIGSCVDYLISEKHWLEVKEKDADASKNTRKKIYNAHDLLFTGSRHKIIHYIEEENLEKKVRQVTAKVWREIEGECVPDRKKRYD